MMQKSVVISFILLSVMLFAACCKEEEEILVFNKIYGVALLDLTSRNNETENGSESGRNLYSADYIMEVAVMPFFTTQNLEQAMQESRMMFFSSAVKSSTFTSEELLRIADWVEEGGIFVSSAVIDINPDISY